MNTQAPDMLRVDLEDGKYTIIQDAKDKTSVLRYGEPWMDTLSTVPGGKMMLGMAYHIERLQAREKLLVSIAAAAQRWVEGQLLGNEQEIIRRELQALNAVE